MTTVYSASAALHARIGAPMLLATYPGLTLIFAGAGALALLALIVISGTRVFTNAHAVNTHLASGIALTPRAGGAAGTDPGQTGGSGGLAARSAQPAAAAIVAAGDTPSEQIFGQLNEYYAANISQGNTIFWASLLSMCIGFGIIFIGIVTASANGVTAIVAAIAGVLSQFIAATFLVVLRSTQQQATTYAQTLVELHLHDLARAADARAVTLGLRLLGEISSDRSDPANATKAAIAMSLIVKSPAPVEPPAVTVELPKTNDALPERRSRGATVTFEDTAASAERR